jgi:hypothetical protein
VSSSRLTIPTVHAVNDRPKSKINPIRCIVCPHLIYDVIIIPRSGYCQFTRGLPQGYHLSEKVNSLT